MSRYGNRYFMCVILSAFILAGIASTGTQAQELPEFYGVYAVHNGKLTELKRNPQSNNYTMTIGGADIIRSLSGITFPGPFPRPQMQLWAHGSLIVAPGTYSLLACNDGTTAGTACSAGTLTVEP